MIAVVTVVLLLLFCSDIARLVLTQLSTIIIIIIIVCVGYTSGEQTRNRDRVLQIHEFYRSTKSSLAQLLATDDDEIEEEEHK